jgi:AraC-like DNA-binding protein
MAEVIEFSGAPTRIVNICPDDEVYVRYEYFTMGENHILNSENSAQRLVTTSSLLKGAEADLLVVAQKPAGSGTHTDAPGRLLRAGDLFTTALWRPFEYLNDKGKNAAFYIPLEQLGLPRPYVERSRELIHASPLTAQLQRHLQILFRDADAISQGPAAQMVGRATTDLVRAVLISAIDEAPLRHDGWQQSFSTVVKSFIAQHLADPDLGAERIARAMSVSVRQLYKLWETEPSPLGQWIQDRRLEAARGELTNPGGSNQTIAAIAGRWGFADSSHFSRRFRQAYGMSPREWRHAHGPVHTQSGTVR